MPKTGGVLEACGGGYTPPKTPYIPPESPPFPDGVEGDRIVIQGQTYTYHDGSWRKSQFQWHEERSEWINRVRINYEWKDVPANIVPDRWRSNVPTSQIIKEIDEHKSKIKDLDGELSNREKYKYEAAEINAVLVPDGAMEWLLHEVGHHLAASQRQRTLPNHGLTLDHIGDGRAEWRAWAFEEIILAPWGPARHFAPPTQRDGVAFEKNGPIDAWHMRFMERRIARDRVDIAEWRSIYGEWVRWGLGVDGRPNAWDVDR
jgi:hypothetical protein